MTSCHITPIPKGHRATLETIQRAARNGALAIVACTDKATKRPVTVLCAIGRENDDYVISPLAKLFDGNPYDELDPPTP